MAPFVLVDDLCRPPTLIFQCWRLLAQRPCAPLCWQHANLLVREQIVSGLVWCSNVLMNMGYYLADKIYPEWAVFVKTISSPQTEKDKLFANQQESKRKDVERAFGVLQAHFDIVRRPARLWQRDTIANILQLALFFTT